MKCAVCSRTISAGRVCGYCGYKNSMSLDEDGDKLIEQRAQRYRENVAGKIDSFSVAAYKWDELDTGNKYKLLGKEHIKIASGRDTLGKLVWSDIQFVQKPNAEAYKIDVELSYAVESVETIIPLTVETIPELSETSVGIELRDEMTLDVYYGNASNKRLVGNYELVIVK